LLAKAVAARDDGHALPSTITVAPSIDAPACRRI
jgi:hypothetical protein